MMYHLDKFLVCVLLLAATYTSGSQSTEGRKGFGFLTAALSNVHYVIPSLRHYSLPPVQDITSSNKSAINKEEASSNHVQQEEMNLLSQSKGRLVVDDFVDYKEAQRLRQLGLTTISGRSVPIATPFSHQVKYLGMTYPTAVQAVQSGNISHDDAKLFLTVSERMRQTVVNKFNLRTPLYHHFTHLVCRSPTVEAPLVSEGKYLPAHSDSCWLNITTGECDYTSGAFTWRHYTSLLYLHEDFEGGKFFFSHGKHDITPEVWVHPKKSRMVAFTAGEENIHGVTHTTKGVRCILEQWYTIDPAYQDRSFTESQRKLNRL